MTYSTVEQSQHDGAPIECYRFVGTFRNYLYTSSEQAITLGGAVAGTYLPLTLKRNTVKAGTSSESGLAVEIDLPFDVDVVKDYAYSESPPSLTLQIIRVHRGTNYASDWQLYWKGKVTSFAVVGRICKVKVPSIFARALEGSMPSAYYQNPCNHVLFDSRCGLARATFSVATTVVVTNRLAFDVATIGFADGYLSGGEALNQRTGERRLILNNAVKTISLNYPFVDMRVGDAVELTAGCDHAWTTCKAKFNNPDNYGGHPFIPGDNPFQGSLS